MIYVSYSIWGFLFSLLAGLSIVKLGLKVSIITFASIVVFSQSLFTAAGFLADDGKLGSNQQLSYVFAIIGNCIFGIGREGIVVCLFTIICRWFEVQEISTAFGINLAIQRFSTIINAVVPTVFKEIPLGIDFLIWLVCTLISLIFAFISNHFELYSQKVDTKNKIISDETKQVFHWSYIFDLGSSFWLISLNSALFYASFNCFNYISEDYVFVRYGESNLNLTNNVHLQSIYQNIDVVILFQTLLSKPLKLYKILIIWALDKKLTYLNQIFRTKYSLKMNIIKFNSKHLISFILMRSLFNIMKLSNKRCKHKSKNLFT